MLSRVSAAESAFRNYCISHEMHDIDRTVLQAMRCQGHTHINWSPPSAAYMRLRTGPALVQLMACCLFDAKSLPEPMMDYCQLDHCDTFRWNMNPNCSIFIHENAIENVVCEKAAFLFTKRWVKNISYRKDRASILESTRHIPYGVYILLGDGVIISSNVGCSSLYVPCHDFHCIYISTRGRILAPLAKVYYLLHDFRLSSF